MAIFYCRTGIFVRDMIKRADAKPGLIQKTVLIQASPAVIYRALTEAKELARWFCDRASSEPRVGGELKARWNAAAREGRAVFTQIIPNSLVELRWEDEGPEAPQSPGARHVLSYSIVLRRRGSEVLLRDEDYPPPDPESVAIMEEGWNSVLFQLKEYCERRERAAKKRTPALAES